MTMREGEDLLDEMKAEAQARQRVVKEQERQMARNDLVIVLLAGVALAIMLAGAAWSCLG